MEKSDLHKGHRERMFSKYSENGIDCFNDHEMLEILLFYIIPRVNTNEIAHMLLNRFGSLHGVLNASISDLQEIDGIGPNAALKIHFLNDFFNIVDREEPKPVTIDSADSAAEYCRGIFDFKVEEQMTALFLDNKHVLIGRYDVKGNQPNSILFSMTEFSQKVVQSKCTIVILAHSHINSPALPSDSDFITTRKIANMLKALGIELEDHIIVTDWFVSSMRALGVLNDVWP